MTVLWRTTVKAQKAVTTLKLIKNTQVESQSFITVLWNDPREKLPFMSVLKRTTVEGILKSNLINHVSDLQLNIIRLFVFCFQIIFRDLSPLTFIHQGEFDRQASSSRRSLSALPSLRDLQEGLLKENLGQGLHPTLPGGLPAIFKPPPATWLCRSTRVMTLRRVNKSFNASSSLSPRSSRWVHKLFVEFEFGDWLWYLFDLI